MSLQSIADLKGVSHFYERQEVSTQGFAGRIASLVRRRVSRIQALDGITLNIREGEKVAVVGPNGSGKSTLLKIILGIIKPTQGIARLFGLDPYVHRRRVSKHYGVVFGNRDLLWWHIPVIDTLRLLKKAYSVEDTVFERNLGRYSSVLGTDELLNIPPQRMSLGQRRRCEFLAALIHEPRLLVLDEPFLGLDIFVRSRIRELLQEFSGNGGTILLSTHEIHEIPSDYRILLLNKGEILYDGDADTLLSKIKPIRTIEILAKSADCIAENIVERYSENYTLEQNNGICIYRFEIHKDSIGRLLGEINYTGIIDIKILPPSLDNVIRELIRSIK